MEAVTTASLHLPLPAQLLTGTSSANSPHAGMEPKPRGYAKLAKLMSSHYETAIFRRFGELNMVNLLSLQAELMDLEIQLQNIQADDELSDHPTRMQHAVDFYEMRERKEDEGDDLQWRMLLRIREKLQEYSIALENNCT